MMRMLRAAVLMLPTLAPHALAAPTWPPGLFHQIAARHYRENPSELMRLARTSARSRITEESLVFTVRGAGETQRHEGHVRIDPGAPDGVRLRLDLGDVTLTISANPSPAGGFRTELFGTRSFDQTRYVHLELEGEPSLLNLQRLMPPVPVPTLALALGDDRDWDQLLPLGDPVEWVAAEPEGELWRVLGVSTGGGPNATPISVWIDARSLHVRRVESVWNSPRGEVRIRVDAAPAPTLAKDRWALDVSGRTPVTGWSALAAPAARIVEDGVFPRASFNERDGRVWTGGELSPAEPRDFRYALVVMYRPGEARAEELIQSGIQARALLEGDFARRLAAGERPPPVRLAVRPAPCFVAPAFTSEGLAAEAARWRTEVGAGPMLFSLAPESTLDAASPTSGPVAVLVGADMRVLGVYPLSEDPASITRAVADRIRRNAWPAWSP